MNLQHDSHLRRRSHSTPVQFRVLFENRTESDTHHKTSSRQVPSSSSMSAERNRRLILQLIFKTLERNHTKVILKNIIDWGKNVHAASPDNMTSHLYLVVSLSFSSFCLT